MVEVQQNSPDRSERAQDEGRAVRRRRISPWGIWAYGLPLAAVVAAVLHVLGYGPFQSLAETLSTESALEQQIDRLKGENEDLQQEIDDLMPGKIGIEKRAREKLGWSKPGEIVVHMPDKR